MTSTITITIPAAKGSAAVGEIRPDFYRPDTSPELDAALAAFDSAETLRAGNGFRKKFSVSESSARALVDAMRVRRSELQNDDESSGRVFRNGQSEIGARLSGLRRTADAIEKAVTAATEIAIPDFAESAPTTGDCPF